MAHKILGNYGAAREGAYFKSEQEADLQRHRDRLVRDGTIEKNPTRADPKSEAESLHAYEVLPEVLQQQARIDDPYAAQRRAFSLRGKATPPPLTAEERYRYRMAGVAFGASVGHIPKLSLGRDRYNLAQDPGTLSVATTMRTLSPEAQEVARRTYMAGLRSLVYGTLLGFGALAVLGTYVAQSMDLGHPGTDLGHSVRSALEPLTSRLRAVAAPMREAVDGWGPSPATPEARSEFQQRMVERYQPSKHWKEP